MTEFEQVTDDQPAPVTPGTMLSQARERIGITQEQVARELHITVSKVKSIESDDYLRLNTDTFIRGYLRAYANFLKLDSAPIIAAYQQHAASQGLVTEPRYPISKEAPTKKLWVFVSLLILLLAGLWLISVWFFDNQVERPVVVPPAVVPSVAVPQASLPATPIQPVIEPAESGEEPTTVTDVEPSNDEGADAVETVTTEESAVEEVSREQASGVAPTERTLDRLELSFAEECWLEVSDAQGDVLATELQRSGSSVSLLGVAPFSVKLGNAPAARVMLNGDEVAINPSAGTKVMTISVGE